MVVTDPISDMICRINNAMMRKKNEIEIPLSKIKQEIIRLLKEEGYIANYEVIEEDIHKKIRVFLKYASGGSSIIRNIKRVSKPGRRIYVGVDNIPKVIEGLGRSIISTSRGILTDKECRKNRLGGEVLLNIW